MKPLLVSFVMAGFAAAAALAAHAASPATGSLAVTATIVPSCTVSNATLNFGALIAGSQATGTTSIMASCQAGAAPALWLSGGNGPYSATTGGVLAGNGGAIGYSLTETGGSRAVPDGSGTAIRLTIDGSGQISYSVTGKILAGAVNQMTPVGTYSDIVTINVAY